MIIAGFPGVGKTYFHNNITWVESIDADCSQFEWLVHDLAKNNTFPANFIRHLTLLNNIHSLVFISTKKNIRESLKSNRIPYIIVYPDLELCDKNLYLERMYKRGTDERFIKTMDTCWDEWITDIDNDPYPIKKRILHNQYMSDIFK